MTLANVPNCLNNKMESSDIVIPKDFRCLKNL